MPMHDDYKRRLFPILESIADSFGTPFHIYDETGIRQTGQALIEAFTGVERFREYFAVKALPNPAVLTLMGDMGFGFDCSSIPELVLSRQTGARGEDIMFTSNNTHPDEFAAALANGGCILNLDDIGLLPKLPDVPELLCFRYNPGERRSGNTIIGKPVEAKFGIPHEKIADAYRMAREMGVTRFGLHAMLASNECDYRYMVQTAHMLLELVETIGLRFEFINIGGGLGIPYRPDTEPLNLTALGNEISALFRQFKQRHGTMPALYMESGRYMTGPHGVLVTRVLNRKETYRTYIGVDANMSALMRPGMYGAYHHIETVSHQPSAVSKEAEVVDVVGALCENNDKFAIQRELPRVHEGDLLVIQDTGAHGHSMGFNYNGRLRPQELMLCADGTVKLIRRAETMDDYFATLQFTPKSYRI